MAEKATLKFRRLEMKSDDFFSFLLIGSMVLLCSVILHNGGLDFLAGMTFVIGGVLTWKALSGVNLVTYVVKAVRSVKG